MKILVVTPRYYPEQFSITKICEELVLMGHDVTVVTGQPNYGYPDILEGYKNKFKETINGVNVVRVKEHARKTGLLNFLLNYFSIYKNYAKYFKKFNESFDVVISHNISPIFTLRAVNFYTKKYNIPHVHYGLDLWPESLVASGYFKKKGLVYKFFLKKCKKWYSKCDYITFASPCTEKYFSEILGIGNLRFKHIYQPCLTNPPDINDIKNHHFFKDNKIHLLYCGTIANFHRLDYLAVAAKSLVDSGFRNFIFDIVGSGSKLETVTNYVNENNLSNFVIFHGRLPAEQTRQYYLNADVLYVPLEQNSFTSLMIPQKLIEYLMYGKPVIGMLGGDGKEILINSSPTNVIVDENPSKIANSIEYLYKQDINQLKNGGLKNRNYFDNNNRFHLQTVCDEIIDICKTVKHN